MTACASSNISSTSLQNSTRIDSSPFSINSTSKTQMPSKDETKVSSYYEEIYNTSSYEIFTWTINENERYYAMYKSANFSSVLSFNRILFLQNEVYLDVEAVKAYVKQMSSNYLSKIYLISIPYPFTEDFYYEHYLIEYPSPEYFVQDHKIYEQLGNDRGYQELKEEGYII